jgi:hypothetical protein
VAFSVGVEQVTRGGLNKWDVRGSRNPVAVQTFLSFDFPAAEGSTNFVVPRCHGVIAIADIRFFESSRACAIGKTLHDMATDNDIESALSANDAFCKVPMISYSSPVEDITHALIDFGESGIPCVITGLPAGEDDERSPFRQSTEWIKSIYTARGRPFHFS